MWAKQAPTGQVGSKLLWTDEVSLQNRGKPKKTQSSTSSFVCPLYPVLRNPRSVHALSSPFKHDFAAL